MLGLALMADGVECFVVAFVLPSAEKDLCLSNAEKGMLGKGFNDLMLLTLWIHYGKRFSVLLSEEFVFVR